MKVEDVKNKTIIGLKFIELFYYFFQSFRLKIRL